MPTPQIGLFDPPPKPAPEPEPDSFLSLLEGPMDKYGLRYYQEECVDAIEELLGVMDPFAGAASDTRSCLAVLATGLGKTQIFSAVAGQTNGRVLILAHRDELVQQAKERLEKMTGEEVEVEQAQWRSSRARIVVGSVQTVMREDRLEEFRKDDFELVVVDEAHHYVAKSYRKPLEYFDAKVLGVTATPDRADDKALGRIFDEVAYSMDIADGIGQGWLVPVKGEEVIIDDVDLDSVDVNKGDFVIKQLDEAMLAGAEAVVRETLKRVPDRQGVVFAPGVKSAQYMAEKFNELKPMSARSVDQSTPKDKRRMIFSDFRAGRIQYLCNCMIATEGFDAPATSVIIQARPTKSRSLYAQMIGRGTRILPELLEDWRGTMERKDQAAGRRADIRASAKPDCLVLDFVGNNTKHKLITTVDVLGGNYSDAEVERAKKTAKESGGEVDPQQALDAAREELKALAKAVKAKVKSRTRSFNPFDVLHIDQEAAQRYVGRFGYKPVSEGQYAALKNNGVSDDELDGMSRREASKLLNSIFKRRELGLASMKQLKVLQRAGMTDINITFENASRGIDYLKRNDWGRSSDFSPAELHRIVGSRREPGEEG